MSRTDDSMTCSTMRVESFINSQQSACSSTTESLSVQVAEEELLRIAASVEGSTRHPLADAVLAAAKERSPAALPAATESSTEPGQGVRATVGGKIVAVGKLDWVQSQAGGSHSSAPMSEAQQWQVRCNSCLAFLYAFSK